MTVVLTDPTSPIPLRLPHCTLGSAAAIASTSRGLTFEAAMISPSRLRKDVARSSLPVLILRLSMSGYSRPGRIASMS